VGQLAVSAGKDTMNSVEEAETLGWYVARSVECLTGLGSGVHGNVANVGGVSRHPPRPVDLRPHNRQNAKSA
jgi:hypothetical protein